jgi:hypothetical protein
MKSKYYIILLFVFTGIGGVFAQKTGKTQTKEVTGVSVEKINRMCCKTGQKCCRVEFISPNGQSHTFDLDLLKNYTSAEGPITFMLLDKKENELKNTISLSPDGSKLIIKLPPCPPVCDDDCILIAKCNTRTEGFGVSGLNSWPPLRWPWKKQK